MKETDPVIARQPSVAAAIWCQDYHAGRGPARNDAPVIARRPSGAVAIW